MSNIKVVDVNNEEGKEEVVEEPLQTEEAKEEVIEQSNEVVDTPATEETASGSLNSNKVGVETTKEHKPKAKAKPKASDKVNCKTCDKSMTYKNYRYRHEKLCTEEPKPVKPQAKPKAKVKMMPKPTFTEVKVYEDEVEEEEEQHKALPVGNPEPKPKPKLTQEVKNQILKPNNPLTDITNHYQLLQNQFIQQKKEKYNNLCQNMFAPKSKKR